MNETNILKTKQHFEILDGLRGLAAIAVVVFHLWNGPIQILPKTL